MYFIIQMSLMPSKHQHSQEAHTLLALFHVWKLCRAGAFTGAMQDIRVQYFYRPEEGVRFPGDWSHR